MGDLSPRQQAARIEEMRAQGKTHGEICRDHPELSEGWDVLTPQRRPRGGGSMDLAMAGSTNPFPD